jgi:hypothetical protein
MLPDTPCPIEYRPLGYQAHRRAMTANSSDRTISPIPLAEASKVRFNIVCVARYPELPNHIRDIVIRHIVE